MNVFRITHWLLILTANIAFSVTTLADEVKPVVAPISAQLKYHVVPKVYYADAVIEAVNQATVSAQISDRITEINFDVDDFVPKGSVLLRFRNKKQKAALSEAQAGVQEAETRLEETRLEFERIDEVFSKKLVSKSIFDKASADYKAANQKLSQIRARLKQVQEELDRTIVTAPYAGIVVKRHVEVGETPKVGQALLTGFSMDSVRAVAKVPQSVVNLISRENTTDKKTYIVYSISKNKILENGTSPVESVENKVAATRVTINAYGDPITHTFSVRVQLPPGLQGIYPGMFVKVAFVIGEDRLLLVPEQAIVYRSEVSAVYVLAPEGDISFRQVRVGKSLIDGFVEALSGLQEGEQVALDPIEAGARLKEQRSPARSRSGLGNDA